MSEETNKRLIERFYKEMWNQWNFELTCELLSDDISFRGSLGAEMRGRTAFCDYMRRVKKSFPDFHNEIGEMVAEKDRVVAHLTYRGTHEGDIFGLPPTGKRIFYTGAAFFHIENNRVAEGWVLGDVFGLLQQLGRNPLLEIRRARTEESNAVAEVLHESFIEFKALYTDRVFGATVLDSEKLIVRMREGPVWIALLEGKIIGTVATLVKGESVYIRGMAVVPAARGSGRPQNCCSE